MTYQINFIAYSKVFSIALSDSLFDVRKSTINMGDFSLYDLLRRSEPLVEDLIWYFKSGMLKGGLGESLSSLVDRLPLTSKHLISAILSKKYRRRQKN